MKNTLLPLLLIGALISGCANPTATNAARIANRQAEIDGSAFRWESQSLGGGNTALYLKMLPLPSAKTKADATLQRDVMKLIESSELTKQRANAQVEDVKHMPDGREVWVLESAAGGLAYVVRFVVSAQGGTDIQLAGPYQYQK